CGHYTTTTATGVLPVCVIKSSCATASRGHLPPKVETALATANNAPASRLAAATGTIAVDAPADLVVCDAPSASLAVDALAAIARGDIPGISCVVVDGQVRVGHSRNSPMAKRLATLKGVTVAGAGPRDLT